MIRLHTLALWMLCLFASLPASAVELTGSLDPFPYAFALHDPLAELTPSEAVAAAQDQGEPWSPNSVKRDGKAYWLVMDVTNRMPDADLVMGVYSGWFQVAELYVLDPGGNILSRAESGSNLIAASEQRSAPAGLILPLNLPEGQPATIALLLKSDLMHHFPAEIAPRSQVENHMLVRRVGSLMITGAMMALILYNLFLGVSLRNRLYFYYVAHAFCYLLFSFDHHGFNAGFFSFTDHLSVAVLTSAGAQFFAALFISQFLEIRRLSPLLARIFSALALGIAVLTLLAPVLGLHLLTPILMGTYSLLTVLILLSAVLALRKQMRQGWYVLVGWTPIVLSSIGVLLAGGTGYIEVPYHYSITVVALILNEMVMMSLALADRIRQLQADKTAVEEVARAKSVYLSTISHEVRTPLNGMLGLVSKIEKAGNDTDRSKTIEMMRDGGNALIALLNNLLDREAGREALPEVTANVFEPRRLVGSTTNLLAARAIDKDILLRNSVDSSVPEEVVGDETLVRQVLTNLIENAVKFTEAGSVDVSIRSVPSEPGTCRLRFDVADTGTGIPEREGERIFNAFAKSSDRSIAAPGVGLGLALSRQIVDLLGGHIGFENRSSGGTRFFFDLTFELPADDLSSNAENTPADAPDLNGKTVLIADDVALNREIVAEIIREAGGDAVIAASAEAAVAALEALEIKAAVLDVVMPGKTGLDLTREIRAAGHGFPIVGLTADASKDMRSNALAAGMDEVMVKPVQPELLLTFLASTTSDHTARLVDPARVQENFRLLGDQFFEKHVPNLLESAKKLAGLDERYGAGRDRLCKEVHRLSGVAATMGLPCLSEFYLRFEAAANKGAEVEIKPFLETAVSETERSVHALLASSRRD